MPTQFPHAGAFSADAQADCVTAFLEKTPVASTTTQTIASPISVTGAATVNGVLTSQGTTKVPVLITASGAISPNLAADYVITKAGIAVMTIAAPTTVVDDGKVITITTNTANQHTVTFTGSLLLSGASGALTATFPTSAGATLVIMAMTAKWILLSNNLVVIT